MIIKKNEKKSYMLVFLLHVAQTIFMVGLIFSSLQFLEKSIGLGCPHVSHFSISAMMFVLLLYL